MLAATKGKMSGSVKKVNKNMYGISSIECATRKFNFRTFYVVVVQNNGKEMFTQSVLHVQSCVLLIRPYVVFFYRSRCLRCLALHDFIFSLSKL